MRKFIFAASAALTISLAAPVTAAASTVAEDIQSFQNYYHEKFPNVPKADFINGVYALNQDFREQWENAEEFPPYEEDIEKGEELLNQPMSSGKSLADCLPNRGIGIRQNYPHFDTATGKLVTLEGLINKCRTDNGEKPFKWKKGPLAQVTAYIAYTSRGNKFNVEVPNDERALAAYEKGKRQFWMKRGQLNMACADCHYYYAGNFIRSDLLSPALGNLSHFPVYRLKWQSLGTPHRRFGGCNKQVRAKPFKAQSDEYKSLEYYLTVMMTGLEANGPAVRK
jgi:sulfur-oxidizing protein SoxA